MMGDSNHQGTTKVRDASTLRVLNRPVAGLNGFHSLGPQFDVPECDEREAYDGHPLVNEVMNAHMILECIQCVVVDVDVVDMRVDHVTDAMTSCRLGRFMCRDDVD